MSHDFLLIPDHFLNDNWGKCLNRDETAFRIVSSFYRIIQNAAKENNIDYVVIDVGTNLGAINRCAIISTDYLIIPMAPDLFSLQALKNIGSTISIWRDEWNDRLEKLGAFLGIGNEKLHSPNTNVLTIVNMFFMKNFLFPGY